MLSQQLPDHSKVYPLSPEYQDANEIERELCSRSLRNFVRKAWDVLEPGRKYFHNWHIDIICEHLEAVTRGEIIRLLINVPPRTMKSLLCSVCWPAWTWINDPKHRWLTASYAQNLISGKALSVASLTSTQSIHRSSNAVSSPVVLVPLLCVLIPYQIKPISKKSLIPWRLDQTP